MEQDAERFDRYGASELASAARFHAEQLEASFTAWMMEALTLEQAAKSSGYTEDHLGRELREGRIPNADRKRAPRILRKDLPLKAGKAAEAFGLFTSNRPQLTSGALQRQIARAR